MNEEQREKLIDFIVRARAEIEGIPYPKIDRGKWSEMTDDQLDKEAQWHESLLYK